MAAGLCRTADARGRRGFHHPGLHYLCHGSGAALFLLCDVLLHYVTPVVFVLWWLISGVDGRTRWSDISWWVLYPIAYLAHRLSGLCADARVAGGRNALPLPRCHQERR
ncbi:Pr6Pr family membrane protein [Mesorhizobium australicum]|uniref:Pr6Pr family membrane protein n=1 Tax=Mesorhizobium australicum TaxID=536018 RepID=UPI003EBB1704